MDISIQGERFGKLVVIGLSSEIKYGCHTVLCRCDCGETISVPPLKLWSRQYKSCGCGRGKRFGTLVAIEPAGEVHPTNKTMLWHCICDCGNETIADYRHLAEGERVRRPKTA